MIVYLSLKILQRFRTLLRHSPPFALQANPSLAFSGVALPNQRQPMVMVLPYRIETFYYAADQINHREASINSLYHQASHDSSTQQGLSRAGMGGLRWAHDPQCAIHTPLSCTRLELWTILLGFSTFLRPLPKSPGLILLK